MQNHGIADDAFFECIHVYFLFHDFSAKPCTNIIEYLFTALAVQSLLHTFHSMHSHLWLIGILQPRKRTRSDTDRKDPDGNSVVRSSSSSSRRFLRSWAWLPHLEICGWKCSHLCQSENLRIFRLSYFSLRLPLAC